MLYIPHLTEQESYGVWYMDKDTRFTPLKSSLFYPERSLIINLDSQISLNLNEIRNDYQKILSEYFNP